MRRDGATSQRGRDGATSQRGRPSAELRDLFSILDRNGDGCIDELEFGNFLGGSEIARYGAPVHRTSSAAGRNVAGHRPAQLSGPASERAGSSRHLPHPTVMISTGAWGDDVVTGGEPEEVHISKNAPMLKQVFLYYIHSQRAGLDSRQPHTGHDAAEEKGWMTDTSFLRFCRDTKIFPDLIYPQSTISSRVFFTAVGGPKDHVKDHKTPYVPPVCLDSIHSTTSY